MIPTIEVEAILTSSTGDFLLIDTSSGALAIRLVDGAGLAFTSTYDTSTGKRMLDVNAILEAGVPHKVIIRDSDSDDYEARVDGSGNIYTVSPAPQAPVGRSSISDVQQGDVIGTNDSFTIIPSGETVTIQRLSAGSEEDDVAGSKVELYYAPNGDATGMTLIEAIYTNGQSDHVDLAEMFGPGDGTKSILLRRQRLGGGANEIFAKWLGYY